MKQIQQNTALVKKFSGQLGFEYCGIAEATDLPEDARRLETWLHKNMHGEMNYMANYFDLRTDPRKLVPGAKSVITLLLNYYPKERQSTEAPEISKYAYGNDYHDVIRKKLKELLAMIKENIGDVHGRGFVDSAPVLERTWAQKGGLGWVGKNGNLINKHSGSFFFIATLITDLELQPDDPFLKDYCGTCTRCIDECPTDAILPGRVVDGSKCISYFTIELKSALLPNGYNEAFENKIFGCDVCQDVCPWNRFSKPTNETAFTPIPEVLNFSKNDWEELTEEAFQNIFRNSAIKRTKYEGIKRNLRFIS